MNTRQLFVASIISASVVAAAASAAYAGEVGAGAAPEPSRAAMKALVLQARAAGALQPAGEATQPIFQAASEGAARTRADVRAEVLQARARGELVAAGEGMPTFESAAPSMLARADVRNEVRMARLQGALIPSGEGFGPGYHVVRQTRIHSETLALAKRR
mgnify:CR=1 FL=1